MNRLGIDIDRVLIAPDAADGRADTSFIGGSLEAALATPPYEGMFETVPDLVKRFGGQVWLVSKAGPRVQEKTRQWLRHHRFFERTGIAPDHLRFCLERPQKAQHCRSSPSRTSSTTDRMSWNTWKAWCATASCSARSGSRRPWQASLPCQPGRASGPPC